MASLFFFNIFVNLNAVPDIKVVNNKIINYQN